ncbi:ribokinase [Leifsonia sp. F6_8S_P_1B]|uniref:Ribokinase n=1 Tax=Leifsonia williamsii TaxID=3035919 RepID=A0ABT8KA18_9MICO|nr:ribokinase [Leifsonia williamsii]MDN4613843.1 ribokinase [Leifsonia williamsii]
MSVIVVGSLNTDVTIRAPRIPAPGETVLATGVVEEPGGKGANQAAAAATLGAQTFLVGAVGDDERGRAARAAVEDVGVRLDQLATVDAPTGAAYVTVDDRGENTIAVHPGANGLLHPDRVADALDRLAPVVSPGSVLVASLEVPVEAVAAAARIGRDHGWTVLLNPAPARPLDAELLALVDVLTPNETEARALGGPDALFGAGVGAIIATRGSDGCAMLRQDGSSERIAGLEARVVNTTGAGDVFTAALACALDDGMTLERAARFANAAGAIAVESASTRVPGLTRAEATARAEAARATR